MTERRRATDKGFTLVETLISIFVLGLISTAGGALLITTFNGQRAIEAEADRIRSVDLALSLVRQDLSNTVRRLAERPGRPAGEQSLYGGLPDRDGLILGLVRGGWTNVDQSEDRSGLFIVEYLRRDDTLVRRVLLRPDAVRNTPVAERVLLSGIEGLELQFRVGETTSRIWSVGSGGEVLMPDAVELVIDFGDRGQLTQRFLVGARS